MIYRASEYAERKEKGLCVKCGKENDTSGVLCSECKEKNNKNKRDSYSFYISIGICPRCHKEKLYGEEKACLLCNAERYERYGRQLNLDREHYNEVHRKSSKKLYAESSAKGICTRCNKRKAVEGRKRCRMCIEKGNAYRRARRAGIPRKYRPDYGLCYLCGDAVKEGQRVCAKCHEKITEGNRKQDRSGRAYFRFGKALYCRDLQGKEKVG